MFDFSRESLWNKYISHCKSISTIIKPSLLSVLLSLDLFVCSKLLCFCGGGYALLTSDFNFEFASNSFLIGSRSLLIYICTAFFKSPGCISWFAKAVSKSSYLEKDTSPPENHEKYNKIIEIHFSFFQIHPYRANYQILRFLVR